MKFADRLFSITALIFLTAISGFACDCLTLSETQSFEKADAVFIGKVIHVNNQGSNTIFTLKVEKSLKGLNTEEMKIMGARSNCDAQFYLGWKYIVYAQKSDRKYFASSCLSTKVLEGPNEPSTNSNSTTLNSTVPWHNNVRKIFLVTVLSVLGSLLIGLLVRKLRKGAA